MTLHSEKNQGETFSLLMRAKCIFFRCEDGFKTFEEREPREFHLPTTEIERERESSRSIRCVPVWVNTISASFGGDH